jgi:hypothetical protein
MRSLREWAFALAVAAVLGSGGSRARASPVTSFESGMPAGWVLQGSGGTSLAVPNVTPTDGLHFGFIDTQGDVATSFTGVAGSTTGSVLTSALFSVGAGEALALDLNFLTNDGGGYSDYAIVRLLDSSDNVVATLYTAQTVGSIDQAVPAVNFGGLGLSEGVTLTPPSATFNGLLSGPLDGVAYGPGRYQDGSEEGVGGGSGWVTSSYAPGAGTYKLQFIVSDVDDELYDSALVIDNIRTSAVSANPEPGSLTLAAVGAISLLGYRLRRRRARA